MTRLPGAHGARALVGALQSDRRTITADRAAAPLAQLPLVAAPLPRASVRRAARRSRP